MKYVTMVTTTRVLFTLVIIWVIIFLSLGIFFWNIDYYFFVAAAFIAICVLLSSSFLLHPNSIAVSANTLNRWSSFLETNKAFWAKIRYRDIVSELDFFKNQITNYPSLVSG